MAALHIEILNTAFMHFSAKIKHNYTILNYKGVAVQKLDRDTCSLYKYPLENMWRIW